jgi:hypothetical protein
MLKRYVLLAVGSVTLFALIAYAADFLVLKIRAHSNAAFGMITIRPYYAVPQKNGKYEFIVADPQNVTCVHSLFPQLGYKPCWYLARHTEQRIDM